LANDTVESRISKRHVCSAAHTPFDRGGCFTRSACSREHARVEIEADNLSCRADLISYESGHNTSAARDVQHAIARFDPGELPQVGASSPVRRHRRYVCRRPGERYPRAANLERRSYFVTLQPLLLRTRF